MKHLRMSLLQRIVTTLSVLFFAIAANAQVQTPKYVSINGNSGGYFEYLPSGYNNYTTYPLIVFVHGIGELGSGQPGDLDKIVNCWTALPRLIANGGFPTSFNVGGTQKGFIVISPQFKGWPSGSDINDVINYAVNNYRVDQSRIYVTGLSMGGGATWDFGAAFPTRAAAIVPVCGATYPDQSKAQSIANAKLPVWALHNDFDGTVQSSYTKDWVTNITNAGGNARKTIFPDYGHDAWTKSYNPSYRENNMNVYEWMLQYTKGGSAPAPAPSPSPIPVPTVSTVALPGKVEAENWSNMSGVQRETTSDAGGGQDVGYIDPNDWMDYSVSVATAGTYTVNFRVASLASNSQLQLKKSDGTVLATVNVPYTGGYQSWKTVSATVNLGSGTQTLRIQSTSPSGVGFNFNWFEFVTAITSTVSPTPSTSTSATTTNLPGKVEAENYSSMYGIQTETTSDAGGGKNIGYIDNGDWMDYSVNASAAGTYTVNFRVATPNSGAQLQIKNSSGSVLATVTLPTTGGFQSWQSVSASINLPAGTQNIRVQSSAGAAWNFNYMEFTSGGSTSTSTGSTSTTSGSRIEAENWSNMSGVQTENTSDAGGGKDVGWIDNGDWMDYSVSVSSAGSYALNFRVSSIYSGSQLQVKNSSGTVLATVNVPLTGGYQTFQTVSANVNLNAGSQTIRIQSSASLGFNFNWFEVAGGSGTTTSTTPSSTSSSSTRIEAENWSSMSGVQTENTSDAGGGKDVGWIDNGDWMNYSYNAPASGTFTVSLRIANIYSGSQFQIKNSAGTVLATVNVPITGGFQTWQTVTASVNLPAGSQTLRLQSSGSAGFNINWLELSQGSAALSSIQANGSIMTTETTNVATTPALDVYPNPTTDRFVLQVNNSLSGNVSVQVINLAGAVQKQFSFSKAAGSTQFYISIGDLSAATYIVKVSMGTWSDSRQIVKQ
jgi:dienelactone hydrolase